VAILRRACAGSSRPIPVVGAAPPPYPPPYEEGKERRGKPGDNQPAATTLPSNGIVGYGTAKR